MQACFFAFGLALPMVLVLGFAIILFLPFTLAVQRKLLFVIEMVNAWASLEVFCVAITAALFEIEQVRSHAQMIFLSYKTSFEKFI